MFLDSLRAVKNAFEYKEDEEDMKVKLAAAKFRHYAATRWENACSKRRRQGKPKIRDWEKMKKKLKGKFRPARYVQDNYSRLHKLKQGNRSVEEYAQEFEHLMMKCNLEEEETHRHG